MANQSTLYPNLNWAQFEVFNDNRTDAFEEMCKDLFVCEYLKEECIPHADHNNPGVEVNPVLEPPRADGKPQRLISYQAKYFGTRISDADVVESLRQAVNHYSGELDVIYLFCNKVISKGTKRYEKYVKALGTSGIELELVTDKDILALLRKHHRVANYYFQDRYRAVAGASALMGMTSFVSTVSEMESTASLDNPNMLLHELLKEKLDKCREAVCDLQFGRMRSEVELLSQNGAEKTEKRVYFYRIIADAHEKKDFSALICMLPEEMKEEAYWLKNYSMNIRALSINEFTGLSIETQVLVLDLLFSSQHWDYIVDLYKYRDKLPQDILKAFDFHYGLSLFNLGDCEKSHDIMDSLYNQFHEQRFKLYDLCALLHKANKEYIFGAEEHSKKVKDLLAKLDAVKELVTEQIKGNEPLIALLELQACFNLGSKEKRYLDEAFTRYEGYSDNAKTTDGVRLFTALCYEMAGELAKAGELLSLCAWKHDETLATRYITNLIDLNKLDEAAKVFEQLDEQVQTPRVQAVYLLALYRLGKAEYHDKLEETIDRCSDSLDDVFVVGFYVEEKKIFNEIVLPKLEKLIPLRISQEDTPSRIGLLAVLAHNNELPLLEVVLDTIEDLHFINRFVVHDIYKCLFCLANIGDQDCRHDQQIQKRLMDVEKIADRFIADEIQKRDFIQIKLLCASANHMVFSMLKYSKELFEYTQDNDTARNIVALLYERNETRVEEYEPYLKVLKGSEKPAICMVVASVLFKLGHYEEADYYAYKAIYNLNGHDDFDVYKSLFGYCNLTIQRLKDKTVKKSVASNMIVTLESEGIQWSVALDSEDGFGNKDNKSLGVEHVGRTDPVYIKLIGASVSQVLNLRGKTYRVVGFEPRETALGRLAFQKVQEYPDEFKGTVWVVSSEDPQEMIKQMIALSDNREHMQALIDAYNFGTNQLGIPIDFFVYGNYEKYIAAQQYLLFGKDLAYYAGEARLENIIDTKYVPALSTLTLLASMGRLDILDWLGDRIVIPESYQPFFREQYALEVSTQANSVGSFVPLEDGKYTIVEPDKRLLEIWESIIAKCDEYPSETVSDDERINYEAFEGYTWERLFSGARIDKIQLDALIVTERENGIYLCDDLFFRKMAEIKGIKNINAATLLYIYPNLDDVMPILMELSKTNYIYTPVRCRNNEEGKQLIQNMLEGEKKKVYYSDYFNAYLYVRDQIMKQYFNKDPDGAITNVE